MASAERQDGVGRASVSGRNEMATDLVHLLVEHRATGDER